MHDRLTPQRPAATTKVRNIKFEQYIAVMTYGRNKKGFLKIIPQKGWGSVG